MKPFFSNIKQTLTHWSMPENPEPGSPSLKQRVDGLRNRFSQSPRLQGVIIILLMLVMLILLAFSISILMDTFAYFETEKVTTLIDIDQVGEFDFIVNLKPNLLYDTSILGNEEGPFYTKLVDTIEIQYTHHLITNPPLSPEDRTFRYQIAAIVGEEEVWQKTITIIPPTTTHEETFSETFILPMDSAFETLDLFYTETGVTLTSVSFSIVVQVDTEINTSIGPLVSTYEHSLPFVIGTDKITATTTNLASSQDIPVTRTEPLAVPSVETIRRQRAVSGSAAVIFALLLIYLGLAYYRLWAQRGKSRRDFRYAQNRLGGLFVQTQQLPPERENEETIQLNSLRDLVNLADETLRPVLYSIDEDGGLKFVILRLGYIRYEYVNEDSGELKAAIEGRANENPVSDDSPNLSEKEE